MSKPRSPRGADQIRAEAKPERMRRQAPGRSPRPAVASGTVSDTMRIAKAIARAGLCSRRDAERWIEDGRVKINGQLITSPARDVGPDDRIVVDGQPLREAEPARLWRYYKPRGLMTTHKDPEGRPTVFEKLPPTMPRVISVGRLDFNTEGLLLLTTDGALARHLELPSTGWLRRYRVRAWGKVEPEKLAALANGVTIDGVKYGGIDAAFDKQQGDNAWLTVALREGKNREVRTIMAHLGLEVNRLIRVSFGPFQLLEMQPGDVEIVKRRVLVDQLGKSLASELKLTDETETAEMPGGRGRPARLNRKPGRARDE
jgi:23S rRNA pseudouridine2605 synthase